MRKERLIGKERYAGYLLIFMQGLIIALLTVFFLNQQYMAAWRAYPQSDGALAVHLKNVAAEKQRDTQNFLLTTAEEQELFITRMDVLLDNSGSSQGYKFGVYGNAENRQTELSFLQESILTSADLKELLTSDNSDNTLGVEVGSINSIGEIPNFCFYEHIVMKQLPALIEDSQTVNGTYTILGLESDAEQQTFLQGLAKASGLTENSLLEAGGGSDTNNLVMRDILFAFLAAQIFLNIVFFVIVAMKSLPKQGKLTLLGWSRLAFAKEILGGFLTLSVFAVPALVLINSIIAGWSTFSLLLLGCYLVAACTNTLILLVELAVSAFVIVIVKPLDAIRGRIPKKTLYGLGIFAYFIISIGLIFCGSYVDQPISYISENNRLAQRWKAVSEYQLLSSISIGQDAATFSGGSKELDQDLYDWYSSISDTKGVYIVQTEYYDAGIIQTWQSNKTYSSTPNAPLWMFTMSPNYLENLGVNIPTDALLSARNGTRLYLLPSTLPEEEKRQISEWLQERDTRSLSDGDIQTAFTQNPSFLFVEYEPDQHFFTWTTNEGYSTETSTPVIYVATPQNMKYTETESLKASGFNGYIKFADAQTAMSCTDTEVLSHFDLMDNAPQFASVHNHIDGLQKNLTKTLMWFGLAFVMLMLILIGLLLALAAVFRIANQEKINVKKFMGFSFLQMYSKPFLLLLVILVLEFAAMLVMKSKFGLLLVAIVSLVQVVIFIKYMAHNELKNVLAAFKGE